MARRIGFLLANVYQGASLAMWRSIASEAKKEKDSALFVFPGGRLRYSHGNEFLRNSIYDLANSSSLDGAIIWASTLSGEVGTEEAEAFARLKSLEMPVVALGMPIEGCPSVNFDAYGGMKDEIRHLITVHGDRKIAFIRGPSTHGSAEERFRAYCDELDKAGIAYDDALVSSPRPWAEGEASKEPGEKARGYMDAFDEAMENDLSAPQALSQLWLMLKDDIPSQDKLAAAYHMDGILGLGLEGIEASGIGSVGGEEEKRLLEERSAAKKARDFARADEIRDILLERGFIVRDTPQGPVLEKRV